MRVIGTVHGHLDAFLRVGRHCLFQRLFASDKSPRPPTSHGIIDDSCRSDP
jgi:hypothetical protein